jgi:hypothetical protein
MSDGLLGPAARALTESGLLASGKRTKSTASPSPHGAFRGCALPGGAALDLASPMRFPACSPGRDSVLTLALDAC